MYLFGTASCLNKQKQKSASACLILIKLKFQMKNLLNDFFIKIIIFNVGLFFLFLFFIFKNIDAFSLSTFLFIILTGFAAAIIFFNKKKIEAVLFSNVLFCVFLWLLLLNKDFFYKDYSSIPLISLNQDLGDLKASIFFVIFPIIFYFLGFLFGAVLKEKN